MVNNDSNHYKFTGKERDAETGLDYFGARYYGNWLGRFLTPDWAAKATAVPYADFKDPQSLNLYSYVRNRPTVMVDKYGHLDCPSGNTCTTSTKTTTNGRLVGPSTLVVSNTTATTETITDNKTGVSYQKTTTKTQVAAWNFQTAQYIGGTQETKTTFSGPGVNVTLSDNKASLSETAAFKTFNGGVLLPMVRERYGETGFAMALRQDWHDHHWRILGRGLQVAGYVIALADPPTTPLGIAGLVTAFGGTAVDLGSQAFPDKP